MQPQRTRPKTPSRLLAGAAVLAGFTGMAEAQITQIGRIGVETPIPGSFVLSATMPLEEGTFSPTDAGILKIIDANGTLVRDTQIDVVERYPDPVDGASVVSLTARVQNPKPGTPGIRRRSGSTLGKQRGRTSCIPLSRPPLHPVNWWNEVGSLVALQHTC